MIVQCSICRKYHDGSQWVDWGLIEPKTNETQPGICPACLGRVGKSAASGRNLASPLIPVEAQARGLAH